VSSFWCHLLFSFDFSFPISSSPFFSPPSTTTFLARTTRPPALCNVPPASPSPPAISLTFYKWGFTARGIGPSVKFGVAVCDSLRDRTVSVVEPVSIPPLIFFINLSASQNRCFQPAKAAHQLVEVR